MEKFPTHWLCLHTGQYDGLDEAGVRISMVPPDPPGIGAIDGRVKRRPMPALRHHFEGDIVVFNSQPQVPRVTDYVTILDPETGRAKAFKNDEGGYEARIVMTDVFDEMSMTLLPALRDIGVVDFVPLTEHEFREMGYQSKTARLEAAEAGTLHYQQPASRLAWMLPYSEWPAHGLTPPADYVEPQQPDPSELEQPKADADELKELKSMVGDLVATSRQQSKTIDSLTKRLQAATAEAEKLRKAG